MPMLEALVCEVHSAALLTATIASAINAFKRNGAVRSEAGLKPYVPGEPAIVSVLRNGMLETDLDEDTVRLVIEFFDDLAPARIALDRYFADANHIGEDARRACTCCPDRAPWRRACQDALVAVRQLHAELARLPCAVHEQLQAADRASAGHHHRRLAVPQRRGPDLRFPTCRSAASRRAAPSASRACSRTIGRPRRPSCATSRRAASASSASRSSFPKAQVEIELPSGRRFTGVVAWCSGTSAGVRFARPLLPNDPLLSG